MAFARSAKETAVSVRDAIYLTITTTLRAGYNVPLDWCYRLCVTLNKAKRAENHRALTLGTL